MRFVKINTTEVNARVDTEAVKRSRKRRRVLLWVETSPLLGIAQ